MEASPNESFLFQLSRHQPFCLLVARVLILLQFSQLGEGRYSQSPSPWSPPEIQVEFNAQPPEPEDRPWWPKTWPLPNLKPDEDHTQAEPVARLPVSYDEQLRKYAAKSNVVLSDGSYETNIRYPLPHEEGILAELKKCCSDWAEMLK